MDRIGPYRMLLLVKGLRAGPAELIPPLPRERPRESHEKFYSCERENLGNGPDFYSSDAGPIPVAIPQSR